MGLFNKCKNLTRNKDCDLVSKIKESQKELEITKNNIKKLSNYEEDCSFPTISNLFSDPRWNLSHCFSRYGFNERSFNRYLYIALTNIPKEEYQKIISEIIQVEAVSTSMQNERKREQELQSQIDEYKKKLGIK